MLNGIDPILIFNFSKTKDKQTFIDSVAKGRVPIVADTFDKIILPSIPIYLSETLTGLYIETEDKSIEIETNVETLVNSELDPKTNQKGLNNTVKITMIGEKNSIGLTLLTSLIDLIFPLVTSKEYTVTYLHGAITVFGGLIHSFTINQNSNNTLYNISLELVRVGIIPKTPLPKFSNTPDVLLTGGKAVGS